MWTPLQRWYWGQYLNTEIFPTRASDPPGHYRLLAKVDRHGQQRMAIDADVVPTRTVGRQLIPFVLSAQARQAGAVELVVDTVRYTSQQMHEMLAEWIYDHQSPDDLIRPAWIECAGGVRARAGAGHPARSRATAHAGARTQAERSADGHGEGVQSLEPSRRHRLRDQRAKANALDPARLRDQPHDDYGRLGTGKSALLRQVLMQIAERGETAIVYDPALEYTPQFYQPARGDLVLNPLDARCPFWSPSAEVMHEAEALTLATSLFPDKPRENTFFVEGPRKIFAHLLTLKPTPEELVWWMSHEDQLDRRSARHGAGDVPLSRRRPAARRGAGRA